MIMRDINLFSKKVKEKGRFLLSGPFLSDFYFPYKPINLVEDPVGRETAEPVEGTINVLRYSMKCNNVAPLRAQKMRKP